MDAYNQKAAERMCLPAGAILQGKYLIGRTLGAGGFGITYQAFQMNLDRVVAIKEFFPANIAVRADQSYVSGRSLSVRVSRADSKQVYEKTLGSFEEEGRKLASINLSGVVGIYDCFRENATAYLVMEYISGQNLKVYLAEQGGKLEEGEILRLLEPVILSLAKIHEIGIIHRDISPDNLILNKHGMPVLVDFGAARAIGGYQDKEGKSLTIIMKQGYAPLEQYNSHGNQGPWTDVYALCATIYHLLTGHAAEDVSIRIQDENSEEKTREELLAEGVSMRTAGAVAAGMRIFYTKRIQNMYELWKALYGDRVNAGPEGPGEAGVISGFAAEAAKGSSSPKAKSYEGDRIYQEHSRDPAYSGHTQYTEYSDNPAYTGNSGYRDNPSYAGNSGYQDNPSYAGNSGYQDNPSYAGNSGYRDNSGHMRDRVSPGPSAAPYSQRPMDEGSGRPGPGRKKPMLLLLALAGAVMLGLGGYLIYRNNTKQAESEKAAAEKLESEKTESVQAESGMTAAEKAESEKEAAAKAESEKEAAAKAESEKEAAEKAKRESEQAASEKAESERLAAEQAKLPYEYYKNDDETVTISRLTGAEVSSQTEALIPEEIGGMKVTAIAKDAFADCTNLQSVSIPASVTEIGAGALSSLEKLSSITVSADSEKFATIDNVLFNKVEKSLICYPRARKTESYSIPSGILSVGYEAFSGAAGLKSAEIPDTVRSISDRAFCGCRNLTALGIPSSVSAIGQGCFDDCGSITLYVEKNSYPEQYAAQNNISYVYYRVGNSDTAEDRDTAPSQPESSAPAQAQTVKDEYLFPDVASRYLTSDEVHRLSAQQACYAKNEVYAMHGRLFASQELREYFNSKSWYRGTVDPSQFSDSVFNDCERTNIQTLADWEETLCPGGYVLDKPGYNIALAGTASLSKMSDTASAAAQPGATVRDEFIFPDVMNRYLTSAEISSLTLQQVCYAKNEPYALHGRKFKSQELKDYFGSKSWYNGTVKAKDFSDSVFNEYERANVDALAAREEELSRGGYVLDQPGYDIRLAGTASLK